MESSHLAYPIIIDDVVTTVNARCVSEMSDILPTLYGLAADRMGKLCLNTRTNYNTRLNIVDIALAIISSLEATIDQGIICLGDDFTHAAG